MDYIVLDYAVMDGMFTDYVVMDIVIQVATSLSPIRGVTSKLLSPVFFF